VAVVPIVKAKEIKQGIDVDDIVSKIMILESSGGKNNYSQCTKIGKFNRYGYGIRGDGSYMCFKEGDDTDAVELWVNQHIAEDLTIGELLCHYNTGVITENCGYYNNYKKLERQVKI
jgi:hypothetical protein